MGSSKLDADDMTLTQSTRAWRDLARLIGRYRSRFATGLALMLINRGAAFVLPASSKYLIDGVILPGRVDRLVVLAMWIAAATVVQAATAFAMTQLLGRTSHRVIADVRKALHERVLRLPLRELDRTRIGALVSRIMIDTESIRQLVGTGLIDLAGGLITTAVGLGILAYVNWRLSLVIALVGGTFTAAMAVSSTRLRSILAERSTAQADLTGRLTETLGGIRVVKSYTAEDREHGAFARRIDAIFAMTARALTTASAASAASALTVGLIALVVLVLGGRSIIAGTMTMGDLAIYVCVMTLVTSPLVQVASMVTQVTDACAGLDRIRELSTMRTEDDDDRERRPVPAVRGDIVFERVTFAYVPGRPVLRDLSFHAPCGSTVALVGPSGAGKSTLTSLVMGFLPVTSGRILVDGHDLARLRLRDYRQVIGAVLQETFLFDGTIADNIRFARPEASDADVRRVSRLAHCDEFVECLGSGYDTLVGERGVRLSGGQRQRVAIARALLADPRILILDEATSSLDSESEALIQDGLQSLRAGRTTFVIAHRLSTIRSADMILVFARGELVERGRHADLLRADGLYRQMHDRQHLAGWSIDDPELSASFTR